MLELTGWAIFYVKKEPKFRVLVCCISCWLCLGKKKIIPKTQDLLWVQWELSQPPERSICCVCEFSPGQAVSCTMTTQWSLLREPLRKCLMEWWQLVSPGAIAWHFPHLTGSWLEPAVSVALALGCENPTETRDLCPGSWVQVCSTTSSACLLCRETGTVPSSWNSWTLPCNGNSAHKDWQMYQANHHPSRTLKGNSGKRTPSWTRPDPPTEKRIGMSFFNGKTKSN